MADQVSKWEGCTASLKRTVTATTLRRQFVLQAAVLPRHFCHWWEKEFACVRTCANRQRFRRSHTSSLPTAFNNVSASANPSIASEKPRKGSSLTGCYLLIGKFRQDTRSTKKGDRRKDARWMNMLCLAFLRAHGVVIVKRNTRRYSKDGGSDTASYSTRDNKAFK